MAFVDDWQRYLTFVRDTALSKFEAQAFLIARLQQARPELAMDLDRRAN